jgi:hypothetical protein
MEGTDVQPWLNHIHAYEREFKGWESRVGKILKRYRDETRKTSETSAKFNILWSNVQTLAPATFSRLPQPDVSRRFLDNDPTGRVASLILERALEFEVHHYPDYRATLRQVVLDRFLGGRGTAWARYEPHVRAQKRDQPPDGLEVTEDTEDNEYLAYECAPIDYVHWRDFGHTVARTWEEVTAVWRRVYMTRPALVERFGKELGNKIPLDATPEDLKKGGMGGETNYSRALIYEIWDKEAKSALWLSKSLGEIIDERDDPLELEGFFPCPRPLFATTTNESLVPIPDFTLYQDQARELDTLCARIDGLIEALQVRGAYNAAVPELGRIFTEATNNNLIPVTNWAAFAEKQGLKGSIDIVDLTPIAGALKEAYLAFEQVKNQIYEITGISDIIRGETSASETATAQRMKGQYANLRLRSMQEDTARFATEMLQLKAQIMCKQFDPGTLVKISAIDQLPPEDQQLIPSALALLVGEARVTTPTAPSDANPLRDFRIEVAADTLVEIDEESEKERRTEFLTAVGGFFRQIAQTAETAPTLLPIMLELGKFGVTSFKIGRQIEGQIDQAIDMLKKQAAHPPPTQQQMKQLQQQQQQAEQATTQAEQAQQKLKDLHTQLRDKEKDLRIREIELDSHEQLLTLKDQVQEGERARDQQSKDVQADAVNQHLDRLFERWKASLDAETKVAVAEIAKQATLDAAQISAAKTESQGSE